MKSRILTLFALSGLISWSACGKNEAPAEQASAKPASAKPAAKGDLATGPKAAADQAAPEPAPKPERILADSGLGVGGKLKAFDIVNCDSGEEYCQVCRFGGSPKIMAVGTAEDEEFRKDLQQLDALVKKYGEEKVKVFAVITDIKDGKASTPVESPEQAKAQAKAIRDALNLTMPVVVPAVKKGGANQTWEGHYNITKSRTVMFADGKNRVKYSAVAASDMTALDAAVKEVVASSGQG